MMKTWPTASEKKRGLLGAVLLSVGAILDGFVMYLIFSPAIVLIEIFLVACAVLQWCIYFNTQTRYEIGLALSNQQKDGDHAE